MSADLNTVTLVGNLVRDAELSYTTSGHPVVKFAIATNRRRKRGDEWVDEASFFDVKSFGKQGAAIAPHLLKGQKVGVSGELQQERWEAQDGSKRSKVVVNAGYIQLLGKGKREEASQEPEFPKFPPSASPRQDSNFGGFEDDIPF